MFTKKILAQRLFYILITMSFSIQAMEQTSSRRNKPDHTKTLNAQQQADWDSKIHSNFLGTCIPKSIKIVTFLGERSLKCHLHTNMQDSTNLTVAHAKFTKAITGYANRLKERGDAFKVVIMPNELTFDANTGQLTLFNYLGTQRLSKKDNANLTVEVRGYFSSASETIINQGALLHVEYVNSDKKPLVLNLAMLNELYRPKESLKLRPQTQKAVTNHQIFLKARKAAKQQASLDTSDCIEPNAYVEKLYLADTTNMLNYYLENYDFLDVD